MGDLVDVYIKSHGVQARKAVSMPGALLLLPETHKVALLRPGEKCGAGPTDATLDSPPRG